MLLDKLQKWLHLNDKNQNHKVKISSISSKILSLPEMQRLATNVALSHTLATQSSCVFLFKTLSDSQKILVNAYQTLSMENIIEGVSPAREWFLDNFYLIQEQIQIICTNLPKNYDKSLPKLANGHSNCPRIYDIASQIISHGDGRADLENITHFVNAYQKIKPLTLGELWAIPLVLGVVLIETLSVASMLIIADKNDRQLAHAWADQMIETNLTDPKKLILIIANMARSEASMSHTFIAALTRRLQNASLSLPLSWIEQHLVDEGSSTESIIQEEAKKQAAIQTRVSNSIDSLRKLKNIDWSFFVEEVSIVNAILEKDPANIYSKMDFNTRDHYRHVIEDLSRKTTLSEERVAESVIQFAELNRKNSDEKPENIRYNHIGYYLIDKGLAQFEVHLGIKQSIWKKIQNVNKQWIESIYFGSIVFLTLFFIYIFGNLAPHHHISLFWLIVLVPTLALITSQLAKDLVDFFATVWVKPKRLPRMDYSKGIPEKYRTLIAVPAMLTSPKNIDALIEALEIRYLGSRDAHLHFMLLTDFNDAHAKEMPNDNYLLQYAEEKIKKLNRQYHRKEGDIFFFSHRPREWNASESVWMGRERKRGKLALLNQMLRNNIKTQFLLVVGNIEILKTVKYVITLDTDTELPRETARQLIEVMSHPLNIPIVDSKKQIVVEGFGILQPRIAESYPVDHLTNYLKIYGNEFGIDPYTRTVSNVYQDLFQEGSFIGKGIYDVEIFQTVLDNRFPENNILSHDLLEGCYLRSGYLSDIALFERSPVSYIADVKRRIRWIRGDWQLSDWLFSSVKNAKNEWLPNPLSFLSKMKLVDNLRRSLVPIAFMIMFILSWTMLPSPIYWFFVILIIIFFPICMHTFIALLQKPDNRVLHQHFDFISRGFSREIEKKCIYLACLPYEAWYSVVAILQTRWRMKISKKHLLEWVPSEQINHDSDYAFMKWVRLMWIGPLIAVVAIALLILDGEIQYLLISFIVLALWFFSPLLMRALSQPILKKIPKLSAEQFRFLHKIARVTWDYFDFYVNAENNWLPPDNFQETPVTVLARRTSPTNIGMALLANLTAYDFGYINGKQLLERTHNTFETLMRLQRYSGHLYNWYDTETLKPLLPRYISTVDSGNLAGHLLTLRQGLLSLPDEPIFSTRYLDGLEDTLSIINDLTTVLLTKNFQKLLSETRNAFTNWKDALQTSYALRDSAEKLQKISLPPNKKNHEIERWLNNLFFQTTALYDEINLFSQLKDISSTITLRQISQLNTNDNIVQIALERIKTITTLAEHAHALSQMDLSFLYNNVSHLLTIGFNVDEKRQDPGTYDLLSSEARLGIFVGIAEGQLFQESWFSLGRLLSASGKEPVLMSWSGSMFEYLMPLLVMPTYPFTLLDQTYKAAVRRQIRYAKEQGVPWGISESGFNMVDSQSNYLYRAFGVPGLGLKRGLEDDLVIAPYASAMALMIDPLAACLNLQRLEKEGFVGQFGFYEAIDYTQRRLIGKKKRKIVKSFMSHHQGMTLLSISYFLNNQPMQRRFMADPIFQSTLLLLQERIPKPANYYFKMPEPVQHTIATEPGTSIRVYHTPNTSSPQVQLLSNGRYHVVITQAGGGYSRWKDLMLTRWREDSTRDNWGIFSFLRDVETGVFCSTQYQPCIKNLENFRAVLTEGHAEMSFGYNKFDINTEIVVSPEEDIELRRVRIHNRSKSKRQIDFTTYFEIVMAPLGTDLSQPAFSNLFVETEIQEDMHAILAKRRSADESLATPHLFHILNVHTQNSYALSYETDRAQFVGRDHTLVAPLAMQKKDKLSNTFGSVLDPIAAIRCQMTLDPDELVIFDVVLGITDSRENTLTLVHKYQDRRFANRLFGLAWTHSQILVHQLNMSNADAELYQRLASYIIYCNQAKRAEPSVIENNRQGQSGLWGYSISGDLPIVLLKIADSENIQLVRQLIQAQAYWRLKGLEVDVVILNEERTSYQQSLQDLILNLIAPYKGATENHPSKVYVLISDQIPAENRTLLETVARVVLSDQFGTIKEQLRHRKSVKRSTPLLEIKKSNISYPRKNLNLPEDLQFFNGFGGFSKDGSEYIIHVKEGMTTPEPWVNILANAQFGTFITEAGAATTWFQNSHEFRLTPFENDPLQDSTGEKFYIRDEETGIAWSPTILPRRGSGDYQIRHGFGYSVFEHIEEGIRTELWVYIASDSSVKFSKLIIHNLSGRARQLSAIGFVSWVLGSLRDNNFMYVVTELTDEKAILARNNYNTDFVGRVAFFNATTAERNLIKRTFTSDRKEFIGRNGSYEEPAILKNQYLSNKVGAGLDPSAAIQLTFDLPDGQSREIIFTLGADVDKSHALDLIQRYSDMTVAEEVLQETKKFWDEKLNRVRIDTPDAATNVIANGWLLYQVLSSRLWGRTGYYQSSGAFGFRDQLQDVLSLLHHAPHLTREHLLLCANHQFEEGDVQHWWHPPMNRGVRTRCSDDYLWLPFALCQYIEATGDKELLNQKAAFLKGRALRPDEESYYELPAVTEDAFSLYEHAKRAIQHGLRFGVHGLPLMGSGDWNDGMNLVGIQGLGESVWLGFFLYSVLTQFEKIANQTGDNEFSSICKKEADTLQQNLAMHAWDGKWFLRAYFDDGTKLGSASDRECKMDSIVQSWSVISEGASQDLAKEAMCSLKEYLVDSDNQLIKLLAPPFDTFKPCPGYIEAYVPGIRENGGQYTHAAAWVIIAFALLKESETAWQLFRMINPVNHGRSFDEIHRYKIEPYVTAGDVYSVFPHAGRGGWSWYTGSAGWMYRLIIEKLLGMELLEGKYLSFTPLFPNEWNEYSVYYRFGSSHYKILFKRVTENNYIIVDGKKFEENRILLVDDGREHLIEVVCHASES